MRSLDTTLIIEPGKGRKINLKELWLYRELFYFFAWRDLKVRYKQTVIGAGWAILQPFLATGVITLVINRITKINSGNSNVPYPVFAYLGLMYWNCFANGLTTVSNSLLSNQGVINKIYFPRIIPLIASNIVSVIDLLFAASVYVIIVLVYGTNIHWQGIALFLPMLLLVVTTVQGLGSFFAALNVKYRDVKAALPFIIQMGIFLTPVIYPVTLIPQKYQIFIYLNPIAGAIATVRSGFFNPSEINWAGLGLSIIMATIFLILGVKYFKRVERGFVDVL